MKILIIHGNTNNKYSLSEDSKTRCDLAIDLIRKNHYDRIIVTGGIFDKSQEGVSVARAMKHYLESQWLEEHIEVEEQSLTTIHNVELLMKTIKPEDDVHAVTSDYHVFRTWLIWLLIAKRLIKVIGAKSKIALIMLKKLFVELLGIGVVVAYFFKIKFPELYFRDWDRTIKNG
ncbi:MAG TPA: YdcF family protein [bacterium]|nr:YdcF family protein [bacterium]